MERVYIMVLFLVLSLLLSRAVCFPEESDPGLRRFVTN